MNKIKYILGIILLTSFFGCEDALKEEVFSQLGTDNFLASKDGIETVLNQAYADMQRNGHELTILLHSDLVMTGRGDGKLGAWEGSTIAYFRLWTWLPSQWNIESAWTINYKVVYDCNTILDNLDNENFTDDFKNKMKGEALALRGHAYYQLFDYFGPVALHTTTRVTDLNIPRSTADETKSQIESDLQEASKLLPVSQSGYEQITKGGALGMLCKFYLNTKQWQKCADMAKQVMDLNKYSLYPDYSKLFLIENEGNSEVMWVQPGADLPNLTNTIAGLSYPGDYPFTGSQSAWPAVIYIPDWFVNSYSTSDLRANMFVKQYVNKAGKTITGYGKNQSLCLKYGLDPGADGGNGGNDYIELRYADILMARAEALNELNGPNAESISLINQIRNRAGISPLVIGNFSSKDALRSQIFQDRDWEFHFEGKTRQDMIRAGKLVSEGKTRGISYAADYHQLYPIPQSELDANSEMKQNDGY